jgi:hypothetical protein
LALLLDPGRQDPALIRRDALRDPPPIDNPRRVVVRTESYEFGFLQPRHRSASHPGALLAAFVGDRESRQTRLRQSAAGPPELLQFVRAGLSGMNQICDRGGMFEDRIYARTKAVFDYFNLPFAAPTPGG